MKRILITISILFILNGLNYNVKACTTFCLDTPNGFIFGRNLDFETAVGYVVVNKRNVKKISMIQPPERPMEWISKYGSISFNQAGRELPYGGMNEKGLVIEQMWLDETKYPELDQRYGLSELQWIQYQLDNSATVSDVIKSDTLIRVSLSSFTPLHFLVCDKYGNKATIEYLNGKMVVHTGSDLPVSVLANDNYAKSLNYLETKTGFGSKDSTSYTSESLDRFSNASSMIQKYNGENMIDYSFDILRAVSQGSWTKWSIVYDIRNSIIYYTTIDNQKRRMVKAADLDFSCTSPVLIANISQDMTNEKLPFNEYSYSANRGLIDNIFNCIKFLKSVPEEYKENSARYPETTKCCE